MSEHAPEDWWSLQRAAADTGLHQETIRKWSVSGRVRRREEVVGRRTYVQVPAADVLREAARTAPRRPGSVVAEAARADPAVGTPADGELRGRVAALEEIVRRYRLIDEHREEIERRHLEIARQHRDIEAILQGPDRVPND